ncbi:hypothetical protein ACS0TY_035863 [Phlomoides rotata]
MPFAKKPRIVIAYKDSKYAILWVEALDLVFDTVVEPYNDTLSVHQLVENADEMSYNLYKWLLMVSKRILKELMDLQKDTPTSCSAADADLAIEIVMKILHLSGKGSKNLKDIAGSLSKPWNLMDTPKEENVTS